jgi:hypothetical protein
MPTETAPTTFAEAIDWIGSRRGHYAMKMEAGRIVISVRVGPSSAREAAASMDESDLEDALIRAIQRIVARGTCTAE